MTSRQEDGYSKPLPSRIRAILDKKKMSRKELADAVGVSRQRIGYYCDGSNVPDAETLGKIAKALDVSADYLLGLTDTERADNATHFLTYAQVATCFEQIIADTKFRWRIIPNEYYTPEHDVEGYSLTIDMGEDKRLFDYYKAVSEMGKAIDNLPVKTARQLLEPFKADLKSKMLIAPLGFITVNDDEELPF